MRFKAKSFSLNLPFGMGGVSLDLTEEAERAAWALYVELGTRISTRPLKEGEGSVREALTSLHAIFEIVRGILRDGGVEVCRSRKNMASLGSIAMELLDALRPRLVEWHTSLGAYEAKVWRAMIAEGKSIPGSPEMAGALVDESSWAGYSKFYQELDSLQKDLRVFIVVFGSLAGVVESERVTRIGEEG